MGKAKTKKFSGKFYNKFTKDGYHVMVVKKPERELILTGGLTVSFDNFNENFRRRKYE